MATDDIFEALRGSHEEQDFDDPKLAELNAEGCDEYGWRRRLQPSECRLLRPYVQAHDAEVGDAERLAETLGAADDADRAAMGFGP